MDKKLSVRTPVVLLKRMTDMTRVKEEPVDHSDEEDSSNSNGNSAKSSHRSKRSKTDSPARPARKSAQTALKRLNTVFEDDKNDNVDDDNGDGDNSQRYKVPGTEVMGYELFCKERKSAVSAKNPGVSEGELLDFLTQEWQNSASFLRKQFCNRARDLMLEKSKAKKPKIQVRTDMKGRPSAQVFPTYVCEWKTCDYQFEINEDCFQHLIESHIRPHCHPGIDSLKYPTGCDWKGCKRASKCGLPFVKLSHLMRHLTEDHPLTAKLITVSGRGENYFGAGECFR